MQLSLRWAERSRRAFGSRARKGYALFGIVQGGDDSRLRGAERARARRISAFEGYAIGGLAVGEPQEVMLNVVAETTPQLPRRPAALPDGRRHAARYPRSGRARHRHVRLRDADPQRPPRHGVHALRLDQSRNARHADDPRPLDEESPHPAARTYSRAYLHHLTKANEMLGAVLLSTINIAYYQALMAGMRAAIEARRFADFHARTIEAWQRGDIAGL